MRTESRLFSNAAGVEVHREKSTGTGSQLQYQKISMQTKQKGPSLTPTDQFDLCA